MSYWSPLPSSLHFVIFASRLSSFFVVDLISAEAVVILEVVPIAVLLAVNAADSPCFNFKGMFSLQRSLLISLLDNILFFGIAVSSLSLPSYQFASTTRCPTSPACSFQVVSFFFVTMLLWRLRGDATCMLTSPTSPFSWCSLTNGQFSRTFAFLSLGINGNFSNFFL